MHPRREGGGLDQGRGIGGGKQCAVWMYPRDTGEDLGAGPDTEHEGGGSNGRPRGSWLSRRNTLPPTKKGRTTGGAGVRGDF